MNIAIQNVLHRPWPLVSRRWVMHMRWHDLLFAHWPVEAEAIRRLIPPPLEVDTFGGRAWIGVVPFRMDNVRLRGLPGMPGISAFAEINVRTYVTDGKKPGVWFLSLDAPHWLANSIARLWFRLNYRRAQVTSVRENDWVRYESRRRDGSAVFRARYRPVGRPYHASAMTLEKWLCERYCLYAGSPGRIFRGEIHHEPWTLQRAEVELETNTMAEPLGIEPPNEAPHALFAKRMDTVVWWPRRVKIETTDEHR